MKQLETIDGKCVEIELEARRFVEDQRLMEHWKNEWIGKHQDELEMERYEERDGRKRRMLNNKSIVEWKIKI